jgi:hypothetical protein
MRRATGEAPATDGEVVFAGPATTTYTDVVSLNVTYTYSLWAVDAGGALHGPVRRRMTATAAPVLTVAAPGLSSGLAGERLRDVGFVVRFNRTNPGSTLYVTRWATRTSTGQSSWRQWGDFSGPRAYFGGQPSGGRSHPVPITPGGTWALRAYAVDAYGNNTGWSRPARATAPYDDRSAHFSGNWRHPYGGGDTWLSTLSTTRSGGASATFRTYATRLTVLGSRRPGTGKIAIYLDGRKVAVRDTRSAAPLTRRSLWTSPRLSLRTPHTVRVVALGTPGRPLIVLDGFLAPR